MRLVDCKYFFMPTHNTKTVYRQGYCPKFHDICMMAKDDFAICLYQKKWRNIKIKDRN